MWSKIDEILQNKENLMEVSILVIIVWQSQTLLKLLTNLMAILRMYPKAISRN